MPPPSRCPPSPPRLPPPAPPLRARRRPHPARRSRPAHVALTPALRPPAGGTDRPRLGAETHGRRVAGSQAHSAARGGGPQVRGREACGRGRGPASLWSAGGTPPARSPPATRRARRRGPGTRRLGAGLRGAAGAGARAARWPRAEPGVRGASRCLRQPRARAGRVRGLRVPTRAGPGAQRRPGSNRISPNPSQPEPRLAQPGPRECDPGQGRPSWCRGCLASPGNLGRVPSIPPSREASPHGPGHRSSGPGWTQGPRPQPGDARTPGQASVRPGRLIPEPCWAGPWPPGPLVCPPNQSQPPDVLLTRVTLGVTAEKWQLLLRPSRVCPSGRHR